MKNQNSYKIGVFALLLALSSCEDILDRAPIDQISDAVVWNDEILVEAYLYQSYASAPFHASLTQEDVEDRNILYPVTVCDEGFSKKTQDEGAAIWKKNLLDKDGGKRNLFQYWGYTDIRRANEFLELIQTSSLQSKDVMAAEMRFIRAFIYFEMVKRYGAVPLIVEAQNIDDELESLYTPRSSEKDIYDFIYDELSDIVDILPEEYPGGFGRATKYAAAALNSRAMMYAASVAQWGGQELDGLLGISAADAPGYWQKSYDASKMILGADLKGGKHSLYDGNSDLVQNFQEIFLNEKNKEVILAKQYAGKDVLGHRWDLFNAPINRIPDDGNGIIFGSEKQCTSISIYLEMAEEFEYIDGSEGVLFASRNAGEIENNVYTIEELFGNKEPRFHASLFYHEAEWRGVKLDWKKWDIKGGSKQKAKNRPKADVEEQTGFGIKKYVSTTSGFPEGADSDVDYIVFRFGEILLNFAEAAFELGKVEEATVAINELRSRVALPLHPTVDRDKIRHERKVELAFEGNRFWDLRRWRLLEEAMNRSFYGIEYGQIDNSDQYHVYLIGGDAEGSYVSTMSEKYYYLPITTSRIANNPKLAPENPGY